MGAYAGSALFASLSLGNELTLFPVCRRCVFMAVERHRKDLAPTIGSYPSSFQDMSIVLDHDYICDLLPHISVSDLESKKSCLDVQPGSMYTFLGSQNRRSLNGIQVVSVRSLLISLPIPPVPIKSDDENADPQ
jgi:hypothetical protein